MSRLQMLLEEIQELQERVAEEVGREAREFGYSIQQGRVTFERGVLARHREMAQRLRVYLKEASWLVIATAPVIYSLAVPLLLLDAMVSLYQAICFPVYGIPRVRRGDYIVMDRHRLQYLNLIERLHCAYCGYANGMLSYVMEVAARTEQFWCPIKHAQRLKAPHSRYHRFLSYGDAEHYAQELRQLRKALRELQ